MNSSGSIPPVVPRRSLWAQFRFYLILIAFVLGGLLAWQIYAAQWQEHSFEVRITSGQDLNINEESQAERLLKTFAFELQTKSGEPIGQLPAAQREILRNSRGQLAQGQVRWQGTMSVRGRELGQAIANRSVEGIIRYDDSDLGRRLSFALTLLPERRGDDAVIRFELENAKAEEFVNRTLKTFLRMQNKYQSPVRGAQYINSVPVHERDDEPGLYDLEITYDELIQFLIAGTDPTVDVLLEGNERYRQSIHFEPQWFYSGGNTILVDQLPRAGSPSVTLPPAEVAPAKTELELSSRPSGAVVRIDGRLHGRTPLRLEVEPGTHSYTLEMDGYQVRRGSFEAVENRINSVRETLRAAAVAPGKLSVYLQPMGNLYVEGELKEREMIRSTLDLAPGTYRVRAQRSLFRDKSWRDVVVRSGETTSLEHDFRVGADPGGLVFEGCDGCEVWIDGEMRGASPGTIGDLAPGMYSVMLKRDGRVVGRKNSVYVHEGEDRPAGVEF